ncbi:MAG: AAA family ATPase [Streptosporangiaceae bacterium]
MTPQDDPLWAAKQAAVERIRPSDNDVPPPLPPGGEPFIITKQHRRFTEFADAVRRDHYIGLCYGPPGVGKTVSARQYAGWDELQALLRSFRRYYAAGDKRDDWHTLLFTLTVNATPRTISKELDDLSSALAVIRGPDPLDWRTYTDPHALVPFAELLIVDEADRLNTPALEQLRDHYDRSQLGMILIGMPGLEKRLARHPQLYSRIGFVHEYKPLSAEELTFVLDHHWNDLGLTMSASDFTDTEAIAAITRITSGNFRLVHRLFDQIARILEINGLHTITSEVVETARETLVIGTL